MEKKEQINAFCMQFKSTGMAAGLPEVMTKSEKQSSGFMDFFLELLRHEATQRSKNEVIRRRKAAKLPLKNDLSTYNSGGENGLNMTRLNQLRELNWLDQGFNLMLMGPSGTGKTFLAAGLGADAVEKGYKTYFKSMENLTNILKIKDMTRTAMAEYKRLLKADLIILDEIMLFPVEKSVANAQINFVNQIYERTCIVTTNKSPSEWAKMLDDEVLATTLLDRLLYHCDILNLSGKSYRMENRKTFFDHHK